MHSAVTQHLLLCAPPKHPKLLSAAQAERTESYIAEGVLLPPEINPLFTELPVYCLVDLLPTFVREKPLKVRCFWVTDHPPSWASPLNPGFAPSASVAKTFHANWKKLFVNNKIILFFLEKISKNKEDLQKQLRPSRCTQMLDVHRGADDMMSHLPTSPITSAIVSSHSESRVGPPARLWWNRGSRGEPRFYGTTSNLLQICFLLVEDAFGEIETSEGHDRRR